MVFNHNRFNSGKLCAAEIHPEWDTRPSNNIHVSVVVTFSLHLLLNSFDIPNSNC